MPQEYRLYLASSRREGPDYSSFARFRSGKAKDAVEVLFYQFVQRLAELEETEYEEVFIDGTKIESMANRYTYHLPGAIFIIKRNTDEFFSRHILCK